MNEAITKKEALMNATLDLVAEQGLSATPVSQITQRANIGVGTIYRYFDSKEELINAVYLRIKNNLQKYVLTDYSPEMPVRVGFIRMISDTIDYFIDNPKHLFFLQQYEYSPAVKFKTANQKDIAKNEKVDDLFALAISQRLFKELPIEIIGQLIMSATFTMARLYITGEVKDAEGIKNKAMEAIWDMIKK